MKNTLFFDGINTIEPGAQSIIRTPPGIPITEFPKDCTTLYGKEYPIFKSDAFDVIYIPRTNLTAPDYSLIEKLYERVKQKDPEED